MKYDSKQSSFELLTSAGAQAAAGNRTPPAPPSQTGSFTGILALVARVFRHKESAEIRPVAATPNRSRSAIRHQTNGATKRAGQRFSRTVRSVRKEVSS
jgi:hypothetical protein